VVVVVVVVVCHHYFPWVTTMAANLPCSTRIRPMELIVVFPVGQAMSHSQAKWDQGQKAVASATRVQHSTIYLCRSRGSGQTADNARWSVRMGPASMNAVAYLSISSWQSVSVATRTRSVTSVSFS